MTIQAKDIWKNIGEIVTIKDNDSLTNGQYQLVDDDDTGVTLYDIKNAQVREVLFNEEDELRRVEMSTDDRLRLLYEANTKIVLNLMREGWVISDEDNRSPLDITPWLEKLKVLKIMAGEEYE